MDSSRQLLTASWSPMTSLSTAERNWNVFPARAEISNQATSNMTNAPQAQDEGRACGGGSNSSPNSDNREVGGATTRCSKTTSRKRKNVDKKYRRYEKPPYSYVGLIALAIQSSGNKMLKLSEILTRINSMFPFFKGEYQGWRDSVRHNLSQNDCFKKVLTDPSRPQSKGNYWTVDVGSIPAEKLKRQNTSVSRNVAPGYAYARDLTDIFDLNTGKLKVSNAVCTQHGFRGDAVESPPRIAVATNDSTSSNETTTEAPTPQVNDVTFTRDDVTHSPGDGQDFLNTASTSTLLRGQVPCDVSVDDMQMFGEASEISDEEVCPTSCESAVPTDSSDTSDTSSNKAHRTVTKQRRDKRQRFRSRLSDRRDELHASLHNSSESLPASPSSAGIAQALVDVQLLSSKVDSVGGAPPNQKPFGDPHMSSRAQLHGSKCSELWSSMDQTSGPEGPPNITWASATPLNDVLPFFRANTLGSERNGVVGVNGPQTQSGTPLVPHAETRMSSGSLFEDQTDFLLEQASILPGRTNPVVPHVNPSLHSAVPRYPNLTNHVPQDATQLHGFMPHLHPSLSSDRLGQSYYHQPLPLNPQPMRLLPQSSPYLPGVGSHLELNKFYPSVNPSSLTGHAPGYAWAPNHVQVTDWARGSAFLPAHR